MFIPDSGDGIRRPRACRRGGLSELPICWRFAPASRAERRAAHASSFAGHGDKKMTSPAGCHFFCPDGRRRIRRPRACRRRGTSNHPFQPTITTIAASLAAGHGQRDQELEFHYDLNGRRCRMGLAHFGQSTLQLCATRLRHAVQRYWKEWIPCWRRSCPSAQQCGKTLEVCWRCAVWKGGKLVYIFWNLSPCTRPYRQILPRPQEGNLSTNK